MIKFSKTNWFAPSPKILVGGVIIFLIIFIILTGFLAFQWWQVKGELGKKIGENENLMKQVNELQAEIDKLKKEIEELKITKEEITGWKTYRNEEYGFEIDYPSDWELKGGKLCKISDQKTAKEKCINIGSDFLDLAPGCSQLSWDEIFSQIDPEAGGCLEGKGGWGGKFEKEIITNYGVRGYKGMLINPFFYTDCGCEKQQIVLFPTDKIFLTDEQKKLGERGSIILISFSYCDCPQHIVEFKKEEIEMFDKVVSTFRFTGK